MHTSVATIVSRTLKRESDNVHVCRPSAFYTHTHTHVYTTHWQSTTTDNTTTRQLLDGVTYNIQICDAFPALDFSNNKNNNDDDDDDKADFT